MLCGYQPARNMKLLLCVCFHNTASSLHNSFENSCMCRMTLHHHTPSQYQHTRNTAMPPLPHLAPCASVCPSYSADGQYYQCEVSGRHTSLLQNDARWAPSPATWRHVRQYALGHHHTSSHFKLNMQNRQLPPTLHLAPCA
jgi:hypothetical protein